MQTTQATNIALPLSKPRNYALDVFRILGAFCVVALHAPLGALPTVVALPIRLGSRWAVPFFLLVTGYFAAQNLKDRQAANYSKSLNNLLAIFLVANCLYCVFYLVDADPTTTIETDLPGLLIGQSGHLWYIGASIFGLLLLQYVVSRFLDRIVLLVALAALALVLVGYSYAGLTGFHVQQAVAHYATAVVFIFGGFLLGRRPELLRYLPTWAYLLLALVGFFLQGGEVTALYRLAGMNPDNQELLLGTVLMAVGLFCLSLTLAMPRPNALAVAGRTYALPIYLYHPLLIRLIYSTGHAGEYSIYAYWLSPLLIFFTTLLLLKAIQRFSPTAFSILSGQ